MNLSFAHLWFKFIHQNFLIYNMCWEDVEVDRSLLKLNSDSKVLTISSAGCNALTYLLDSPQLVHSVDINPRQTALLDLKVSMINNGLQDLFYECFWNGKSDEIAAYYDAIKSNLAKDSRAFWNDHLHYFDPKNEGLLFQGGSGYFARFLNRIINRKGLRSKIELLANESDKATRSILFNEIEDQLWSGLDKKIWPSNAVLSLAGIPKSQQLAIGDMNRFMKDVVRYVFVHEPVVKNPYWGRYLKISGVEPQSDSYLHYQNFDQLHIQINRLEYRTSSLNDFLDLTEERYSHCSLLDHMDWMVGRQEYELTRLWNLLEQKTKSDTIILFRTAFADLSFLPDNAFKYFEFEQVDKEWLNAHDRVGTYTGTYTSRKK